MRHASPARSVRPLVLVTATIALACAALAGCSAGGSSRAAGPSASVSGQASVTTSGQAPATASGQASAPASTATGDILTYRGDPGRSGVMPGPGPSGSQTVRWSFQASGPIGSQVAVRHGVVYLMSTDGTLAALDLQTGKPRWKVKVATESHASPVLKDDLVIVGAEDGVHAVHQSDGGVAWTATTTGPVRGAPAIVAGRVVTSSRTGTATALDPATGAVIWTRTLGAADDSSVAATDGVAVFGRQDGWMVALSVSDGAERWRVDTGDGARIGTPTIVGSLVYAATLDGRGSGTRHVFALDLTTGARAWSIASPGDVPAYTPAVADGLAIVDSESHAVVALDALSGTSRWQVDVPGVDEIVAAIADGVVYTACNGGPALALDLATGAERWRVPVKGTPYGMAVTSGLVLVGTDVGILYAIGDAQQ